MLWDGHDKVLNGLRPHRKIIVIADSAAKRIFDRMPSARRNSCSDRYSAILPPTLESAASRSAPWRFVLSQLLVYNADTVRGPFTQSERRRALWYFFFRDITTLPFNCVVLWTARSELNIKVSSRSQVLTITIPDGYAERCSLFLN